MKTYPLMLVALLLAFAGQSQPLPRPPHPALPPRIPPGAPPAVAPAKEAVNYLIRVEWKKPDGGTRFVEVLTTEGQFNLDTMQKDRVKIGNNEVPVTLKFQGTLTDINDEKGRLSLYLGRTVPYVTGTYGNGPNASPSYSQMSIGLNSTFIVKFGQPEVIQNDDNGQVSVLVKRMKD